MNIILPDSFLVDYLLLRAAADEVAVAVAVGACRLVMNSMGCDAEPRFLFAIFV